MEAERFSLRELAGQRLMVGFDGLEFGPDLAFLIEELCVGGVILFARNIAGPAQLEALCRDIQRHARRCGLPPLLVAIDQEGGPVTRLRPPFTQFSGPAGMTDEADAARFAAVTATELRAVGINMNLAPVLDVAPPDGPSVMIDRVFGGGPQRVAHLGGVVIAGLQRHGVMAVAKHFPGIGRTILDSHQHLPVLDVSAASLETCDLVPFRAAMARDVTGVMLSHILYPQLDPDWPASLSPAIARDLLRRRLGYAGLVLTDDLDMGAVAGRWPMDTCIRQIVEADVDMALICHRGPSMEAAAAELQRVLTHSPDRRQAGRVAVERILAAKARFVARPATAVRNEHGVSHA
jgi:beta-N-acetylhexosaminidase